MTSAPGSSDDTPRAVAPVETPPATELPARRQPGVASSARQSGRWRSADLFGPAQEIEIEHGQAIYRLRRTSLGKLILTK